MSLIDNHHVDSLFSATITIKNLTELTRSIFNYTIEKFDSICCYARRVPDIKIFQPLHFLGHLYQQPVAEVKVDQGEPLYVAGPLLRDMSDASPCYLRYIVIFVYGEDF